MLFVQDGIGPGSNLLTAVEALVSGVCFSYNHLLKIKKKKKDKALGNYIILLP